MNKKQLQIVGIVCLVIFFICAFVAVERYQANAANVNFMKQMPFGNMGMKPAMPAATKYAIFFGILSGGGAVACFILQAQKDSEPDQKEE